ncbi:MAG: hypothetical protein ACREO1_07035 [Arenimonas sp.]
MLDIIKPMPVLPKQLVCKHADARCNASRFLRRLESQDQSNARFAYGNENEVRVCRGKHVSGKANEASLATEPAEQWRHVHHIFEQHGDRYIFGFLGYGLGLVASTGDSDHFPPYWLGIAELVVRFSPDACEILYGDTEQFDLAINNMAECACQKKTSSSSRNSIKLRKRIILSRSNKRLPGYTRRNPEG